MSDVTETPTTELEPVASPAAEGPSDGTTEAPDEAAPAKQRRSRRRSRTRARSRATRDRRGGVDRVLTILATLMLPGGLAVILLGWYGASHTPFLFEQIPYMISGGLVGIGLMIAGGLLYVGSWLARLAEQERDDTAKVRELIAGLRVDLQQRLTDGSGPPSTNGHAAAFVATPTGSMYHRPDCSIIAGRDDLRPADPDDPKATPCRICNPV